MRRKLLLSVCFPLLFVAASNACSDLGLMITYEYTGTGNDYTFRVKFNKECSGTAGPGSMAIHFTGVSCPGFVEWLPLSNITQVPLNSCAGFDSSSCSGYWGNFGYNEYTYEAVVTVPPCSDWVAYSVVGYYDFVTNLESPTSNSNYVETKFDNLNFPGNSSPSLNVLQANYYCNGVPSLKDYSAVDIDGDSLRYEFVPAINPPNYAVPMDSGFTYDQPLATSTPSFLDPVTGLLVFTPNEEQVSAVAIRISEYRNGVLIGSIVMNDFIVVTSGNYDEDIILGRVYYDNNSNGVFDAGDQGATNRVVHISPGDQVAVADAIGKYEFLVTDGDWNLSIPNPPLYTAVNPSSIYVPTSGISSSVNNDFILSYSSSYDDLEVYLHSMPNNPVPGDDFKLQVTCKNTGTNNQSNVSVQLTLDPLLQYNSAIPPPDNIVGNTLTWTISSMTKFSMDQIEVRTTVSSSANPGTPVNCNAVVSSAATDNTPGNNTFSFTEEIAGTYIPNFMDVTPQGDIDLSFVTSQEWLTYRIYFQNLGSAPAQIIRITGLLDPDLEIASVELVASSFPCTMTFTNPNQMKFEFFGINLPTATTNEPGSHGFLVYRLKPESTLTPGTYILNNALIHFDLNAPVYTNLVQTKVVTTVGLMENESGKDQIALYPNPASSFCVLEINSSASENVDLTIYNFLGQNLKSKTLLLTPGLNQVTIPVSDFAEGNYFLIFNGNNYRYVKRFSVVK